MTAVWNSFTDVENKCILWTKKKPCRNHAEAKLNTSIAASTMSLLHTLSKLQAKQALHTSKARVSLFANTFF